jgi:integrase
MTKLTAKRRHAAYPSMLKRMENVGFGEALLNFADWHRSEGNKEFSITSSVLQVSMLGRYLDHVGKTIRDVDETLMTNYLNARGEGHPCFAKTPGGKTYRSGPSTRRCAALEARSFLKFCYKRKYIPSYKLGEYELPKAAQGGRRMATAEEIGLIMQSIVWKNKPENQTCVRHRNLIAQKFYTTCHLAIVGLASDTGMRSGEIFNLTLDDYNREDLSVFVRGQVKFTKLGSKTGENRTLPITKYTADLIDAWLKVRNTDQFWIDKSTSENWKPELKWSANRRPAIFLTEGGTRINVQTWSGQFKNYRLLAKVEDVVFHQIRHFAITQAAKTSLLAAQHLAGHRSSKTTERYAHSDADFERHVHTVANAMGQVMEKFTGKKKRVSCLR